MKRRNFLKGLFTIPMLSRFIFAGASNQEDKRLEAIIDIIKEDRNLNKKVPKEDIEDAIDYAISMNKIILEAIDKLNITTNEISVDNLKDINEYIVTNYKDDWILFHGKTVDEQKSGFHKIVKSGARTKLFDKNAINRVFNGIYHIGFPTIYKNRLVDENGDKSVSFKRVANWLTNILNGNLYSNSLKILIPLYSYPTAKDENRDLIWDKFIEIRNRYNDVEVIAVINPDNGDFITEDSNYVDGIKKLVENDIRVMGYVYTGYALRYIEELKNNIESWREIYQIYGVEGIFFDEVSEKVEDLEYYKDIINYTKENGFEFTILNAGYTTAQEYIDESIADIVVTLEESEKNVLENPPLVFNVPTKDTKLSLLVYDMQSGNIDRLISLAREKNFSYIYFTEDNKNPWNSLSKYFEEEISKALT